MKMFGGGGVLWIRWRGSTCNIIYTFGFSHCTRHDILLIFNNLAAMLKLHFLTNDNALLQQKMRFFADYFSYANTFLGKLPNLPFDNPLSLIDKIVFQLENNIERSPKYIEHYYSRLLNYYQEFLLECFPSFATVDTAFNLYLQECGGDSVDRNKVKWLKENEAFLNQFEAFRIELKNQLFEKVFYLLNRYIVCEHVLRDHKDDISFCTQILVSYYRLSGFSKFSVSSFMQRILSKDVYSFPFPLEIYSYNKDDCYLDRANDYLDSRNFSEQFEGFRNLKVNIENREGYFIYCIDNVRLQKEIEKNFKVELGDVTFISPLHSSLKMLKNSVKESDTTNPKRSKVYPKFFRKGKLLAFVKLKYEQKDEAGFLGHAIVEKDLVQLNLYLHTNLQINTQHYLFTENFERDDWSCKIGIGPQNVAVIGKAYYQSARDNPYKLLEDVNDDLKFQLLHNEDVFSKAMSDNDVSSYWQYIENLFWFQNKSPDKIRQKFIKVLLKQIESLSRDYINEVVFALHILNLGVESREIGLEFEEVQEIWQSTHNSNEVNKLPLKRDKITHPFLIDLIDFYNKYKSNDEKKSWEVYFEDLLLELYDFRNAYVHSGRVNESSRIKLLSVLPSIMNKARWYILHTCKHNPRLLYPELLDIATR